MKVRPADAADGPALQELFLRTPLEAGTAFVLDRSPDFWALLRLRGEFQTFVACDGPRIIGTATALWHDAIDGVTSVRVGEILDLRVEPAARGSPAALRLLTAVRATLEARRVDWAVCLVGDRNLAARGLVTGKAGFPALEPLSHWASVHYVAWRTWPRLPPGVAVREVAADDVPAVRNMIERAAAAQHLVPTSALQWPDLDGRCRAWIASADSGIEGVLVSWDGEAVRRLRVVHHRLADAPLRLIVSLAAGVGLAPRLPGPGEVLRMWATRWLVVPGHRPGVSGALVRAALRAAAAAGVQLLQVNVPGEGAARRRLPLLPRSTYWSTLYGRRMGSPDTTSPQVHGVHHADVALV